MPSDNELLEAVASSLANIEAALGSYPGEIAERLNDIEGRVEFLAESLELLMDRPSSDED